MLDQNTTTVLTTLITIVGTLGGVVLDVILFNRYVARQEKAKRNTAVIEEVYTLFTNIKGHVIDNIDHDRSCFDGKGIVDFNHKAKPEHKIYLEILPEPYTGNPEAKILLLNLNPGFYERNEKFLPSLEKCFRLI